MVSYKRAIESSKAYKTILKDCMAKRLSHTYLLVSEDEAYLKEFAKVLCGLMLELKSPASLVKLEKDIHPDVIIYGENEKINTAQVSEISTDVYVRPYEGDYKAYILLNLQDMNDEAQNKLLKTIEEPPKSAFFVLATTSEKSVLQTVLSRSKKIELDLIDKELIISMLKEEKISEKESSICAACSGGVFSRALKLAEGKEFFELYQNVFNCLYKMNSSRDVLYFTNLFSSKNVDKAEMADLFMMVVRDLIMVKTNNESLVNNSHKLGELKLISEGFSLTALYKIIEYCLQLKKDLVYNTSMQSALDHFLLCVVEVKVRCKE